MDDNREYMGQFTLHGVGYSLEGAGDLLYVERLTSPTSAVPVCTITGRDRNTAHELLDVREEMSDECRAELIRAAVEHYRAWLVDH
ncbi:hypothetical protein [Nocardia wallacei]|uniref:hypothetical protein n=1 Tax=Nocardia wallacei TaxID=480035 RepID=UPI0024583BE4|nr:hypothetical protein [Nocardia wallacei]